MYCEKHKYKYAQIRSPDSDIFFLLLYYACRMPNITLLFDTGKGNKRRLINISDLSKEYSEELRSALLGLHAFTGCDSTSAFKGIGKIKPIKLIQKVTKFCEPLGRLGEEWEISDDTVQQLEELTCALYGKSRFSDIDEVRHVIIKSKCKENSDMISPSAHLELLSLPPCRKTLVQHIRRCNYQVAIWKRAHIAKVVPPSPTEGHGWRYDGNRLEPLWCEGDVLPPRLVDVLVQNEDEQSDDEIEMDIEDSLSDDDQNSDSDEEM